MLPGGWAAKVGILPLRGGALGVDAFPWVESPWPTFGHRSAKVAIDHGSDAASDRG